jgi:hypothetical protein
MIVVVGGHSRNIGKTAVMEGLARALPDLGWTAVKITQHGHGICSSHGKLCSCDDGGAHPFAISEETAPSLTDSGRYLAAGALRSYWLRTRQGELAEGMPALRRILAASRNTLIESNSVMNFLKPDVYLFVLDYAVPDLKDSARRFLERADALVTLHDDLPVPWPGVPARWLAGKPRFAARPPLYVTPELAAWVRSASHAGKGAAQG